MVIDIGPASTDDLRSVEEILDEATRDLSRMPPRPFGSGLDGPAAGDPGLAATLADPDSVLIVARRRAVVVGFGLAVVERGGDDLLTPPFLRVHQLAVRREFRRNGVGRALVEALEEWGRRMGLAAADLSVFEGNQAALGLFGGLGYRPLEHRLGKLL